MRDLMMSAFSGRDNTSLDIGRILGAGGFTSIIGYEGYALGALHQAFDAMTFSGALSAFLVALGGSLAIKAKTEPQG